MVRETRFTWDDTDGIDIPQPRDRIDDLDADFLDAFAQDGAGGAKPKKPRAPRTRPERPARETDSRRHLAGGDWLRDGPRRPKAGS